MVTTRSFGSTLDRMLTLNRALDHAFNSAWSGDGRVWVPAIDVVGSRKSSQGSPDCLSPCSRDGGLWRGPTCMAETSPSHDG